MGISAQIGIGDIIAGKYRVERVLGHGGMGVVVAALHLRLRERVAIKFPACKLRGRADVGARLVREARAAMRIHSEHVARVYDVGALATGEPYLVMEYLLGRDLGALVGEAGRLSLDASIEYILQASEALAEAHALAIVHRDIKPSNLFLTRRADGSESIKVIDFGISKIASADGEDELTDSDAIIGSRPFMAPEQMRSARESDARSDIWALGATLYTLLTGQPPFLGGSLVEIHERIVRGAPALRTRRSDAPAALEAIVERCLRADPAQRYADIADFAEALAQIGPLSSRGSGLRARRILHSASSEGAGHADASLDSGLAPSDEASTEHLALALADTALPREASWQDAEFVPATIGARHLAVAASPIASYRALSVAAALLAVGFLARVVQLTRSSLNLGATNTSLSPTPLTSTGTVVASTSLVGLDKIPGDAAPGAVSALSSASASSARPARSQPPLRPSLVQVRRVRPPSFASRIAPRASAQPQRDPLADRD